MAATAMTTTTGFCKVFGGFRAHARVVSLYHSLSLSNISERV